MPVLVYMPNFLLSVDAYSDASVAVYKVFDDWLRRQVHLSGKNMLLVCIIKFPDKNTNQTLTFFIFSSFMHSIYKLHVTDTFFVFCIS